MTVLAVQNTTKNDRNLPTMVEEKRIRAEQAINKLFEELKGIYPAWKAAFETPEDFQNTRRVWLETLISEKITPKRVEGGIQAARSDKSPFIPSVGQFVAWCRESLKAEYAVLGLPSEEEAVQRFKSYMGYHKHDRANFNYRSKAEYWFCCEAYKHYAHRDEKYLEQGVLSVLREAADKVRAGFDFPAIPKFVQHIPVIDPKKFDAGIAKCKAVLRGVAQ